MWHHEVFPRYGRIIGHHKQPADRLFLNDAYGVAMWSIHLGLDAGAGEYSSLNNRVSERWLGSDRTYGVRRLIGPVGLKWGWGIRLTRQTLIQNDTALLGDTAYAAPSRLTAVSHGPTITWAIPLSYHPAGISLRTLWDKVGFVKKVMRTTFDPNSHFRSA